MFFHYVIFSLAMCFTERGDYVVRKNQDVDGVYFLLEGQVSCVKLLLCYLHKKIDRLRLLQRVI